LKESPAYPRCLVFGRAVGSMVKGCGSGLTAASSAPPPMGVHSVQWCFGARGAASRGRGMESMGMVCAAVLHGELPTADVNGLHDGLRRFSRVPSPLTET
jgi:hypothetical protein